MWRLRDFVSGNEFPFASFFEMLEAGEEAESVLEEAEIKFADVMKCFEEIAEY